MYIRRVVIKNFRNLQSVDLEIDSGLTCLVGENNSGKSNFLTALRLVFDTNYPNFYRKLNKEDFTLGIDISRPQQIMVGVQVSDFNSQEDETKVKEHALVQEWCIDDDIAQICYRFRPRQTIRQDIESGERNGNDLTIDEYGWELVCGPVINADGNIKDLKDVEWNDEFRSGNVKYNSLEAYRVSFLPAIRDVDDDLKRLSTSPLHKMLDIQDIPEERKDVLVNKIREVNQQIIAEPEIQTLRSDIDSGFNNTVGNIFGMNVSLGMSDATFQGISRSLKMLLTGFGLSEADIARNGLGLNNALYISMLLKYFEKLIQREDTAGELLLVEEPEAHLHPQLQQIIFSKLLDKECQVIASTHSTHITCRGSLNNITIFTPDNSNYTMARNIVTNQYLGPNEVEDLERYLDATKSVLLFARRVILVEGMSEVFVIPKLVEKVMGINLENLGISIVPIHGVHFSVYLKLFGPDVIRKKCLVLTDGDVIPSDAREPDDGDFGEYEFPTIAELVTLENDYVKIKHCVTTFEMALAVHRNLKMFSEAAMELGATRISATLLGYYTQPELSPEQVSDAQNKVLNTAKRFGKARFAQVVSKYYMSAEVLPDYIQEGINWVIG